MDIRRYFPITAQARVAWSVKEGVGAATVFVEQQIEAGLLDGGVARCHATTRKGKACQRTPLPSRDYPVASASRARHRRRLTPRPPAAPGGGAALRPPADDARFAELPRGRPAGADRLRLARGHMSHDADKLIRRLSLVAFLMAERRPLTARDVKSNVEGYSEMSDEAFAPEVLLEDAPS